MLGGAFFQLVTVAYPENLSKVQSHIPEVNTEHEGTHQIFFL
jgi:hypothetical protein